MGLSPDSEQLQAAQRWLNAKRITNENGMEYMAFDATTWNTASLIRTAMQADISPHDPRIANSIAWLIAQQTTVDAPKTWQNPKPFAPRTGAWAFHAGRSLSPDCDTTGRALDALGHVLQKSPLPGVQEAVRKGLAWLLPMQNEDGGWPSMTRDLGTKPSGPITTNGFVPPMTVPEMVAAALNPPLMMQDPSTAPMSGRIITGIKNCQADGTQSGIDAAIDFLKVQQWHNRWWGRWEVNYIAGTAFSLIGATTCGVDSKEPWLANAAAWLESQQNDDGGWGESSETYYDWQAPGPFPSRPDLTAKVVLALLRSGNPNSKHLSKAIGYLLAAQDDNGCWNTMSDQDVVIPPDFLYTNPLTTQLDVLAALTCYQRAEQG